MFWVPSTWVDPHTRIQVVLVGAGGNGSEMLDGLARIDRALRMLGHRGLRIEVYDPDTVSESNTVRQRFWPSDVGHSKSELLMHRYGLFGGLYGNAHRQAFTEQTLRDLTPRAVDLIVTCADKAIVREWIGRICQDELGARLADVLWLDLGNGARTGQVILGHLAGWRQDPQRLPNVRDLFPELADHERLDGDDAPSCSAAESLTQQDLFINRWVATAACDMLWQLLRRGQLDYHGFLVNESGARVREISADPVTWASFGLISTQSFSATDGLGLAEYDDAIFCE